MSQQNRVRLLNENDKPSTIHSDEIDLLDLLFQLWKGKTTILICIIIMLVAAVGYLAVAQEKWTSTALIQRPWAGQLANYDAAMNVLYKLSPQDNVSMDEQRRRVFREFVVGLSSTDQQTEYLLGSDYFKSQLTKNAEPTETERGKILDHMLSQFSMAPVSKDQPDVIQISFTADKPDSAQKMLNGYIQQVASATGSELHDDVRSRLAVQLSELEHVLKTQEQVAEVKKQDRIAVLKEALKVAEASNVEDVKVSQAETLSDDTLFLLGAPALRAMIANESSRPLSFDQVYYDAQQSYLMVKEFKLQKGEFGVFSYLQTPDLPVTKDSPKKALVLVLSVLIGGVLGAGIVLMRNMIKGYRQANGV